MRIARNTCWHGPYHGIHWPEANLLTAVAVALSMQVLTALGFWSVAITVMVEPFTVAMIMQAALAYIPAILVMVGVATLLIGFRPKSSGLAWLYLGYSFLVIYFGGLLQVPGWLKSLTPFGHVPQLPVEEMNLFGLIVLTAIAVVLAMMGLRGYRRRDIYG